MKFVDFGDLVEVTYDDESVELISKEKATELDYKDRQKIEITYKNNVYNSREFSNLTKISCVTVLTYYNKGLYTGEEIIEAYSKQKLSKQETELTYKNEVLNCAQFSKLTQIDHTIVQRYYKKGLRTGEEIIEAYNKTKEYKCGRMLTYQGEIYSCSQFSKLTKINVETIRGYYNKGLHTGEEMLQAYNKAKNAKQEIRIRYKGQVFTGTQFSALTQINTKTICNYYRKGLRTGEEMIAYYNRRKHK